jgi:hypothetical protein
MDRTSLYPITLGFREPRLEQAYTRFRVSRTLYKGDIVFIAVRLAIIVTYVTVAKGVTTYKYAAFDAVGLVLQGAIVLLLPSDTYAAWRDTTLLMFRFLYFFSAALGIPHHLHSLPLADTPRTALRVALLGSGSISNALLGLGMPQMLKTFHVVQALCVCGMALLVNRPTCAVMLELPSGPDFVSTAWHFLASNLRLVASYWVGLPAVLEGAAPTPRKQCAMLLSFLHFWVGFTFPTAVWYVLERLSRQHFLRLHAAGVGPEEAALQQELDIPPYLMLLLWLLVALLLFCALWDLMRAFG